MSSSKNNKIVFTFGRFQSPTIGHAKLINHTIKLAKETGAEHRIYASKSHDPAKNPIPYNEKLDHLRNLFPDANVVDDPKAVTAFHVMKSLSDEGKKDVTMVVGADRVEDFKQSIGKYVKSDKSPGFDASKHYNFDRFHVTSAGARDENASGVEGASGTKMRGYARSGDFNSFAANTPTKNLGLARKIFNSVKNNLTESEGNVIKEELDHVNFSPMLDSFVSFASEKLGIKSLPSIKLQMKDDAGASFGGYRPHTQELIVSTLNRHPMDIYRTVAHELVHHKQNEDGKLGKDIEQEGSTGSDIENEANSEAGKIMRWYAKSNPDHFTLTHVTEEVLHEGINDPGIFKAVFLAGGPGSGKDFILNKTLAGNGLTEINSDLAFEFLLKKHQLSLTMPPEELEARTSVRDRAKSLSKEKQRLALFERQGLIINGTADDPDKIVQLKQHLESLGYETMMVFVDTNDKVSKQRNIERGKNGGREVPEDIRSEKWQLAQQNKEIFKDIFGEDKFSIIDNSEDLRKVSPDIKAKIEKQIMSIFKKVRAFVTTPPKSDISQRWVQQKASERNITQFTPPKVATSATGNSELNQAKQLGLTYYGFGRYGKTINGVNTTTHISVNGKLQLKPKHIAEEVASKSAKKPEVSFGAAKVAARLDGSESFKHNGVLHSTINRNETEEAWRAELEAQRVKSTKAAKAAPPPKKVAVAKNTQVALPTPMPVGILPTGRDGLESHSISTRFVNQMARMQVHEAQEKVVMSKKGKVKRKLIKYDPSIDEAFGSFVASTDKKKIAAKQIRLKRISANQGEPGAGLGPELNVYGPLQFNEEELSTLTPYVRNWILKENVQNRYLRKYNNNAKQSLYEIAVQMSSIKSDKY